MSRGNLWVYFYDVVVSARPGVNPPSTNPIPVDFLNPTPVDKL